MSISTLADVKLALCVATTADDALLTALMAAADDWVTAYCGRDFGGGSYTELFPGGARLLFLRNYPVAAVQAVLVDPDRVFAPSAVRDPAGYVVYPDRGVVESVRGPFVRAWPGRGVGPDEFPAAVQVRYTTPAGPAPAAVCKAYADLIGVWFREAMTCMALGQQNVIATYDAAGVTRTKYVQPAGTGFVVPDSVRQLLDAYRVPPV